MSLIAKKKGCSNFKSQSGENPDSFPHVPTEVIVFERSKRNDSEFGEIVWEYILIKGPHRFFACLIRNLVQYTGDPRKSPLYRKCIFSIFQFSIFEQHCIHRLCFKITFQKCFFCPPPIILRVPNENTSGPKQCVL